jgi:hypothetical protein
MPTRDGRRVRAVPRARQHHSRAQAREGRPRRHGSDAHWAQTKHGIGRARRGQIRGVNIRCPGSVCRDLLARARFPRMPFAAINSTCRPLATAPVSLQDTTHTASCRRACVLVCVQGEQRAESREQVRRPRGGARLRHRRRLRHPPCLHRSPERCLHHAPRTCRAHDDCCTPSRRTLAASCVAALLPRLAHALDEPAMQPCAPPHDSTPHASPT